MAKSHERSRLPSTNLDFVKWAKIWQATILYEQFGLAIKPGSFSIVVAKFGFSNLNQAAETHIIMVTQVTSILVLRDGYFVFWLTTR